MLSPCFSIQVTQGDVSVERDTYKQSRQGLDEMYNEAQRQLKEECQLRQVSSPLAFVREKHLHLFFTETCGGCLFMCAVWFLGCGERVGRAGVDETGNGVGHETSRKRHSWKTGQHRFTPSFFGRSSHLDSQSVLWVQIMWFSCLELLEINQKHSTPCLCEQDTLIGLRNQLDEVKAINVEMYQKMQVSVLYILDYILKQSPRVCFPINISQRA